MCFLPSLTISPEIVYGPECSAGDLQLERVIAFRSLAEAQGVEDKSLRGISTREISVLKWSRLEQVQDR